MPGRDWGAPRRAGRQRLHQFVVPRCMARIGDHRMVRDLLEERNAGGIEGVAHCCLKGADAAFAEDDVGVAVVQNYVRRAQKVSDGGHHAALQEDRLAGSRRRFQQRVVLHAARADLQDVGILGDQRDVTFRHHLSHNSQSGFVARCGEQPQAFEAQALKHIGRTTRLEGASMQNARSGAANMMGRGHELRLGFHRTRPRHGDELCAADDKIEHRHTHPLAPRVQQNIGGLGKSSVLCS